MSRAVLFLNLYSLCFLSACLERPLEEHAPLSPPSFSSLEGLRGSKHPRVWAPMAIFSGLGIAGTLVAIAGWMYAKPPSGPLQEGLKPQKKPVTDSTQTTPVEPKEAQATPIEKAQSYLDQLLQNKTQIAQRLEEDSSDTQAEVDQLTRWLELKGHSLGDQYVKYGFWRLKGFFATSIPQACRDLFKYNNNKGNTLYTVAQFYAQAIDTRAKALAQISKQEPEQQKILLAAIRIQLLKAAPVNQ